MSTRKDLDWAVSRWQAEVANRPLVNVHRLTLDTTWRQVIRHFGGDPDALVGPSHDELCNERQLDPPTPPERPTQSATAATTETADVARDTSAQGEEAVSTEPSRRAADPSPDHSPSKGTATADLRSLTAERDAYATILTHCVAVLKQVPVTLLPGRVDMMIFAALDGPMSGGRSREAVIAAAKVIAQADLKSLREALEKRAGEARAERQNQRVSEVRERELIWREKHFRIAARMVREAEGTHPPQGRENGSGATLKMLATTLRTSGMLEDPNDADDLAAFLARHYDIAVVPGAEINDPSPQDRENGKGGQS